MNVSHLSARNKDSLSADLLVPHVFFRSHLYLPNFLSHLNILI